jgi:hypothetical protein
MRYIYRKGYRTRPSYSWAQHQRVRASTDYWSRSTSPILRHGGVCVTHGCTLELIRYQTVLRDRQNTSGTGETDAIDPTVEKLRMSPLVWWNSKEHIKPQQRIQRGYAVLGHIPEAESSMRLFC